MCTCALNRMSVMILYLGPGEIKHVCCVAIIRAEWLLHERLSGDVRVVLLQTREGQLVNNLYIDSSHGASLPEDKSQVSICCALIQRYITQQARLWWTNLPQSFDCFQC